MDNLDTKIEEYKQRLSTLQNEQQQKNVEFGVLQQTVKEQQDYFMTNFGTSNVEELNSKMNTIESEIIALENDLIALG